MFSVIFFVRSHQLFAFHVAWDKALQHLCGDGAFPTQYRYLLGDILQLSYIPRPLVFHQQFLCLGSEGNPFHTIFLCHLQGKESEEQCYIFPSLP